MPCETGKKCYPSKHNARESVKHMGQSVRVYPCGKCNFFHVTKEQFGKPQSNSRQWNAKARRSERGKIKARKQKWEL